MFCLCFAALDVADEEGCFDFSYKNNPDVFFTARAVGGSKDAVFAVLFGSPNSHVASIPRQESNFAAVCLKTWLAVFATLECFFQLPRVCAHRVFSCAYLRNC